MPRYASRSWRSFDADAHEAARAAPAQAAGIATLRAPALSIGQALAGRGPRRVLGLDPGSRNTGYGIVDCDGGRERHVASGCVQVRGSDLATRLHLIHQRLVQIVEQFRPDEVAVERVFMHRNADSALKLGQARGAALTAAVACGAVVYEYAPRAVKLAVVGTGAADKTQVAHMVQALLAIAAPATADVSDALAIALCHAHARRTAGRLAALGLPG